LALEARTQATTTEKSRGRIETRTLTTTTYGVDHAQWPGLRQFIRLERQTVRNGKQTQSTSYAITSLPPGRLDPKSLLDALRRRWDIENRAFWVFDVVMGEDHSRIRSGQAPQVMSTVRATALNLIRGLGLPIAATLREHAFKVTRLFTRLGIMKK